jgi:hypothetical protein
MNADYKVITPEQRWHAGRQADAFFGLLEANDKLKQEHLKLQEETKKLRKALKLATAAAATTTTATPPLQPLSSC